ncbi:MAG: ABC transporter substrate-binding protein [Myxococcota bacterium]
MLGFPRTRVFLLVGGLLVAGCECSEGGESDESELVVVLPRDAEELDPRFLGDPYGLRVSRLLFASLVTIDPRTLDIVPDLAETVAHATPTTVMVRLRPDLAWSDGRPITADDVVATFRGVTDPALGSRFAGTFRRIVHVEAEDPRTVRFELDGPHATFVTDLEMPILPARYATTRVRPGPERVPFSGPYRLVGRSSGQLQLEANPNWHHGTPRYPKVRMVVIRDDNTRALRLLGGQGDLALHSIPPLLVPLFEEDERFEVRSVPGVSTAYIGIHTEAGPLRDGRVRRAIAHAIDRTRLLDAKLNGRGTLASGWIPPGHWAFDAQPEIRFDPERARAHLDEAGVVDPSGPEPRLRLSFRTSTDRFRLSVARAIAAMLADVGIEADVRPSESATLIADLNAGRFELCLLQVPEVFEPHVLSWFFDSNRIPKEGRPGANRWRYQNSELDRALEAGRASSVREVRVEAYHEVQRLMARDLPVVPLWHEDVVAVVSARGADFDVPRDGRFGTLAR